MTGIQFITDEQGVKVSVVVPINVFERLIKQVDLAALAPELYQAEDGQNDELIPHEVVEIMVNKDVTIQAAWRLHRGMTQKEVAAKLGIKQAAVSQFEKSDNPRPENLLRLAELYGCRPTQLVMS
jgi:DNA-binding XRE family transcriptional regulator